MSRASEALTQLRQAEAAARAEVGELLATAGMAVREIRPDGDGWYLRVGPAGAEPLKAAAAHPAERASDATPLTRGARALLREPGESVMALVSRAGDRLRVSRGDGPGGIRMPAPTEAERVSWLGGTLVGDTILALRHVGEPEDGERADHELQRQFGLFRDESRRVLGGDDPAPFLEALERWTPASFPRGRAFLARAEEGTHA